MDDDTEELMQAPPEILNVADLVPQEHRHDRIIGNQLICSMHDACGVSITVKPTQVLEENEGALHLVDKAPR